MTVCASALGRAFEVRPSSLFLLFARLSGLSSPLSQSPITFADPPASRHPPLAAAEPTPNRVQTTLLLDRATTRSVDRRIRRTRRVFESREARRAEETRRPQQPQPPTAHLRPKSACTLRPPHHIASAHVAHTPAHSQQQRSAASLPLTRTGGALALSLPPARPPSPRPPRAVRAVPDARGHCVAVARPAAAITASWHASLARHTGASLRTGNWTAQRQADGRQRRRQHGH